MSPEQTDSLLSRNPSWMAMGAPVPAHVPGDSTPKKEPIFPGNNATYGDQSSSGGGGSTTGSTVTAWLMTRDGTTVDFEVVTVPTV